MAEPIRAAETFAGELAAELGPRVRSIVLYGSVARGDAIDGVSDVNLLVLFDRLDVQTLEAFAPRARRWVKANRTPPLVLTAAEWQRAADVFAIELADMKDWHRRLHGEDPIEGARVVRGNLRLQAERELRGKHIQLREALLVSADRSADVGTLLLTALPSFTTYLRAALRLREEPAPADSESAIRAGCALVGADPVGLLRALEARRAKKSLSLSLHDSDVRSYYEAVEKTASFVDTLPGEAAR